MVFRSASTPAPPEQSDPAMVRTRGVATGSSDELNWLLRSLVGLVEVALGRREGLNERSQGVDQGSVANTGPGVLVQGVQGVLQSSSQNWWGDLVATVLELFFLQRLGQCRNENGVQTSRGSSHGRLDNVGDLGQALDTVRNLQVAGGQQIQNRVRSVGQSLSAISVTGNGVVKCNLWLLCEQLFATALQNSLDGALRELDLGGSRVVAGGWGLDDVRRRLVVPLRRLVGRVPARNGSWVVQQVQDLLASCLGCVQQSDGETRTVQRRSVTAGVNSDRLDLVVGSKSETRVSIVGIGETLLIPDSLWIPIPTSISSSLSKCFCSSSSSDSSSSWCLLPGMVQWSKEAPIVTRLATTFSPTLYTSAKLALLESLAAFAPVIL
ncbi:hypothetical protein OGAPHI_005998 [Ogataea philodendri]|uniref:Uncharacterized protein n=1 Tax=Ogataea philodendri TaxID=1378263 RepID=A0A9P8T1D1_9ASCO|nr:uncharacterized protein OGAPHI_005998 [Ogataea philodendri]KAH3661820.1 hypothetical protein OGAPHI_005998 [Ogataea philodendri]